MTCEDHSVLLVEDDDDIREALAELLQDEGYHVTTARNGLEALTTLRSGERAPCVILLDLMMPVMNGFQFLEAFRKDPALSVIPVAVVTAHGAMAGADRAALGAPIVAKPIAVPALLQMLEQLC